MIGSGPSGSSMAEKCEFPSAETWAPKGGTVDASTRVGWILGDNLARAQVEDDKVAFSLFLMNLVK